MPKKTHNIKLNASKSPTLLNYLILRISIIIILLVIILSQIQFEYFKSFTETHYLKTAMILSEAIKVNFDKHLTYVDLTASSIRYQFNLEEALNQENYLLPENLIEVFDNIYLMDAHLNLIKPLCRCEDINLLNLKDLEELDFNITGDEIQSFRSQSETLIQDPKIYYFMKIDNYYLLATHIMDINDLNLNNTVDYNYYEFIIHDSKLNTLMSTDDDEDINSYKVLKTFSLESNDKLYTLKMIQNSIDEIYYYHQTKLEHYDLSLNLLLNSKYLRQFIKEQQLLTLFYTLIKTIFLIVILSIVSKKITKPLKELNQRFKAPETSPYYSEHIAKSNIRELDLVVDNFSLMNAEMIKRENDLKEFAYIASHDLQEPLRGISNYLDILKFELKDKLNKETLTYFNYAIEGSERMKTLILDLLEYSRTGQQVNNEMTNLKSCIDLAIQNNYLLIQETHTEIIIDDLPTLNTDGTLVTQLFDNLIRNAIKFSKPDITPVITISYAHSQIRFKDNGIGIDDKYFEEIFKPFKKLHPSHLYKGSGIGLALCSKIIESLKWSIAVESELGSYTTFIINCEVQNE